MSGREIRGIGGQLWERMGRGTGGISYSVVGAAAPPTLCFGRPTLETKIWSGGEGVRRDVNGKGLKGIRVKWEGIKIM